MFFFVEQNVFQKFPAGVGLEATLDAAGLSAKPFLRPRPIVLDCQKCFSG
jgi:hypothetical protein